RDRGRPRGRAGGGRGPPPRPGAERPLRPRRRPGRPRELGPRADAPPRARRSGGAPGGVVRRGERAPGAPHELRAPGRRARGRRAAGAGAPPSRGGGPRRGGGGGAPLGRGPRDPAARGLPNPPVGPPLHFGPGGQRRRRRRRPLGPGRAGRHPLIPLPLPLPDPPLSDGAVALRPPRHVDASAVTAACRDPEIHRWTFIPQPYRLEDAQGWIASQESARASCESLALLAVDARDDALLGAVGLTVRSREHDRLEIGYWTAAEARGRGVATTGVLLLTRWAFGVLGARRVEPL